ncbi:MAG TPA: hypothetical protein VN661_00795 [Candidatus Acidoferrales bacterium]|nr:hypothetical protein [Candidatus Acidoferrales bacterium]
MNLKQRLSLAAAAVLPALALSAYFLITPLRAIAQSCPPGEILAGCGSLPYCNDGHGGCDVHVGQRGVFVFCPGEGYNGTCVSSGCVQCDE